MLRGLRESTECPQSAVISSASGEVVGDLVWCVVDMSSLRRSAAQAPVAEGSSELRVQVGVLGSEVSDFVAGGVESGAE